MPKLFFFLTVILAVILMPTLASSATLCSNPSLDSDEQEFLVLINQYRAQNGLAALQPSAKLSASSQWMAEDLASHDYFAHTSSDGRNPFVRMIDCGYQGGSGENIAGGLTSAQDVFIAWKNSPGHNANMLGNHAAIGIGRALGGPYRVYWVTDFGVAVDSPPLPSYPRRAILPMIAKGSDGEKD